MITSAIQQQPVPVTMDESKVRAIIDNALKQQRSPESLSKEKIEVMIQEVLNKQTAPTPQSTSQSIQKLFSSTTTPVIDIPVPVLKKKNAHAPENEKRADQFKTVLPPDSSLTRTGKKKIVRIPFSNRMASADVLLLDHYDELKNYILSFKVKSRLSNTGDTFRLHKEEYVKITIAGKSLKLYLALNPEEYRDSTIPVDDASDKKIYQAIPLVFKVKSPLSVKRAKQLIDDVMKKKGLEQKEIPFLPWSKQFKQ
jgi:hypothetical protein